MAGLLPANQVLIDQVKPVLAAKTSAALSGQPGQPQSKKMRNSMHVQSQSQINAHQILSMQQQNSNLGVPNHQQQPSRSCLNSRKGSRSKQSTSIVQSSSAHVSTGVVSEKGNQRASSKEAHLKGKQIASTFIDASASEQLHLQLSKNQKSTSRMNGRKTANSVQV